MAERDEARLLARIEAGERIESPDEMTETYRENLIHLMTMQADSELAGGYGYVPWITKSPDIKEWFKEHTVVAGNFVAAYPEPTVQEVLKALEPSWICEHCGAGWPDVHVQVPPRPKRRAPPNDLSGRDIEVSKFRLPVR